MGLQLKIKELLISYKSSLENIQLTINEVLD